MDAEQWSEGRLTAGFEAAWGASNALPAVAFSSWSGAALAALAFAEVAGEVVLCPSNTFMATPLSAVSSGARVEFVDANRDDLCVSYADFVAQGREIPPQGGLRGPHRRPHRLRDRADRRVLPCQRASS